MCAVLQVLLGDNCHIYNYEAGGISALGGLAFHVIHNEPNGELPLEKLQQAIRCSAVVCLDESYTNLLLDTLQEAVRLASILPTARSVLRFLSQCTAECRAC